MSGVVLRCPNCGTTQALQGECEACHEADVRYFCPNHTPGRWLDAPVCAFCGARIGGTRPRTATPPPAPRRDTPITRVPPVLSRPPRAPRERDRYADAPGELTEDPVADVYGRAERPVEEPVIEPVGFPRGWRVERPPVLRVPGVPVLGCLRRLVGTVLMMVLLLAMATCWFFGGNIVVVEGPAVEESPASGTSVHAASLVRAPRVP